MKVIWSLVAVILFLHMSKATGSCTNPVGSQLLNWAQTHQEPPTLVTRYGTPADNPISILTAGPTGPLLLQDTYFIETIQAFDRERVPERTVHAKGAGAFGFFEITNDITQYSMAQVFSQVGLRTPVMARFSQVTGEMGSADTARDARGFAVKFYTSDGIWDLVSNNSPVFFVRDPELFPSFAHSVKRNPVTHVPDANSFWDFAALQPQVLFQTIMVNSDNGIPASYRNMNGYGVNTFILVNSTGNITYCKFHLVTNQGIKNLSSQEGAQIAGTDPNYFIRDLYNAIGNENFPSWNFSIQVMTQEEANNFRWSILDATKIWPQDEFPLIPVGRLVLNQNPNNYFANVEQLAFDPSHLVPGIQASNDKILQGRLFSYKDTQIYRLGPNFNLLPVNRPTTPVHNYERDGFDRYGNNMLGAPNVYPNSFNGPVPSQRGRIITYPLEGSIGRFDISNEDNFSQPTMFWNSLTQGERRRLVDNIASSLSLTYPPIQNKILRLFGQVSGEMEAMLSDALQATPCGINSSNQQ